MTEAVYPDLSTLSWSVLRTVKNKTRTQNAVSGRQTRILDQLYPIRTWTLTYELLRDTWDRRLGPVTTGYDELRTIEGFYMARRASFQSFLFEDITDNYTAGWQFATGDGTTTSFQLTRPFGGFYENITAPNNVEAIYADGETILPDSYSVSPTTGIVTFSPVISNGVALTADFSYYWRVHFQEDQTEFENFMYQLWTLKQVKLEQLLA